MADTSVLQQRFSTLDSIHELANPYLDQQTVVSLYQRLYPDITTQLNDATIVDDRIASIVKKVTLSNGTEPLQEDEIQSLRQTLFSALMVKANNLRELANKTENQSFPNLGFSESLGSVQSTRYQAYLQKKSKNREFIAALTDEYSKKMRLTRDQKDAFKESFIQRASALEQKSNFRPLDPQVYVKEADAVAAAIIPKEQYTQNKATLIAEQIKSRKEQAYSDVTESPYVQEQYLFREMYSGEVKRGYESFQEIDRREELYAELQTTIVSQEKVPRLAIPFVALEAATAVIAKEKPSLPAKQIMELANKEALRFAANQGDGVDLSTNELVSTIKELVNERGGFVQKKQVEALFLNLPPDAPNKLKLLREIQRQDIQNNIGQLLDHINDNEFLKETFGGAVTNQLFIDLTTKIKEQSQNTSGTGGLSSLAASGSKVFGDAATSLTKTGDVEQNLAFQFLLTNQRMMVLSKENPDLHKRFEKKLPLVHGGFPHPEDAMQALFALAIASQDPQNPFDIKHFQTLARSTMNGINPKDPQYQMYLHLFSYLEKLMVFNQKQQNLPQSLEDLNHSLLSKVYLMYFLSTKPEFSTLYLKFGLKNLLGGGFSLPSFSNVPAAATAIAGIQTGIKTAIVSTNPIARIGVALLSIGSSMWRSFKGVLGIKKEEDGGTNWGLIASVVMIPIALLLMGNVQDQKRIQTPVAISGGGRGSMTPSGETGVDCNQNPTSPLCQFEQCTEENGRNCLAPSCGCITQEVNGGHSHGGFNAIDIGIGAGGRAGTCNGELNPVATSPIAGRVIFVGVDPSYGNVVVIQSQEGFQLVFAHLASFAVSVNQEIDPSDPLGRVNNTGNSTGTHLHFERRDNSGQLTTAPGMREAGVYRAGLPQTSAQNVRSLLPAGSCF